MGLKKKTGLFELGNSPKAEQEQVCNENVPNSDLDTKIWYSIMPKKKTKKGFIGIILQFTFSVRLVLPKISDPDPSLLCLLFCVNVKLYLGIELAFNRRATLLILSNNF